MKIVISNNSSFRMEYNLIKKYFDLKCEKIYFYKYLYNSNIGNYKLVDYKQDPDLITKDNLGEYASFDDIINSSYFEIDMIERDDIFLIKAVEEINPNYLKILEIPDDVKWYIHESDSGVESIHEEHRVWI